MQDARPRVAGVIPQRRGIDRNIAPAHDAEPLTAAGILDGRTDLTRRPLVADEQHEEAQLRCLAERGADRVRDEPARDREQHARAVAGLFVRGERAAVTQLREALQSELHHSAVGATRDVCHESDPARVPLERPVGPGTSARGEPSVGRRHGSPPRLRSERTPYVAGVSSPFRPYERCVTTPACSAGALDRNVTQPLRAVHRFETAAPYAHRRAQPGAIERAKERGRGRERW